MSWKLTTPSRAKHKAGQLIYRFLFGEQARAEEFGQPVVSEQGRFIVERRYHVSSDGTVEEAAVQDVMRFLMIPSSLSIEVKECPPLNQTMKPS